MPCMKWIGLAPGLGLWFVAAQVIHGADPGSSAANPAAPLNPAWWHSPGLERVTAGILEAAHRSVNGATSWPAPKGQCGVFVAVRATGSLRAEHWELDGPWAEALPAALTAVVQGLDPQTRRAIDGIEVCLNHSLRDVVLPQGRAALADVHRGVRGLEIARGATRLRWSPTEMLARNLSFTEILLREHVRSGSPRDRVASRPANLRLFEALQVWVRLGPEPVFEPMFRGNPVVPLSRVTAVQVRQAAEGMGDWLVRQVQPDGRLPYLIRPGRGTEVGNNNALRQMMASMALGRWARFSGDPRARELQRLNLAFNMRTFFREEDGLGFIENGGEAKLGSAALGALAILESPWRSEYAPQEAALLRLVGRLWRPDGSFQTYFRPAGRAGNENFYPGEALLLWASLIDRGERPDLLNAFHLSYEHYRGWHLDPSHRNPAFIPWHTKADVLVWRKTRDPGLRDFVFTMNDWLLQMQQWDRAIHPDLRGRFHLPTAPGFGPPHASSTGVYLEGLADAFWLARETGDEARAARYRLAILRGIRSLLQLQFVDDIDLFYAPRPGLVRGGVRTTVYNNEIRIDNVQHGLMALLNVLSKFQPADFAVADREAEPPGVIGMEDTEIQDTADAEDEQ